MRERDTYSGLMNRTPTNVMLVTNSTGKMTNKRRRHTVRT
jgi:hypothetical protein